MAAFAQASRAPTPSRARQSRAPTLPRSPSSHDQTLPFGSCNSRDHTVPGANPPTCGCKRFWRNPHRPEDGGDEGFEYPWCICGHHACFHDDPGNAVASSHNQSLQHAPQTPVDLVQVVDGVYVDRVRLDHATSRDTHHTPRRRGQFTRSLSGDTTVEDGDHGIPDPTAAGTRQANATPSPTQRDNSDLHISGFPSVPSICYPGPRHALDSSAGAARQPRLNVSVQPAHNCIDRSREAETDALRAWHKTLEQRAREQSQLASTVRYSTDAESDRPRNSPSRAFLDHVLQSRRAAAQADSSPTAVKREDAAQSATDLATSSIVETQDVQAYDQHLQETTSIIDNVVRGIMSVEAPTEQTELAFSPTQPNTSQRSSRNADDRTPDPHADSVASVPMSVPWALRKLAPQLLSLKRHLAAQPNISTTIQNISDRLWMLENASFQHVPAEEICDKFDLMDGRLLDVEHRLVDIERLQEGSQTSMVRRNAAEDGSYYSEFTETFTKFEQRLQDLEVSVPSPAYPWEIEVVLFPWGRDLNGIWFSQSELQRMSQSSKDRRSNRNSSISPFRIKGAKRGGFNPEYEQLFPKACGPRNKVYRRLKSRGFIKNVAITEPGARHILTTIHDAFGKRFLEAAGDSSQLDEEELKNLGLMAPVIPLRKIPKDKQLQFLPPSEMVSPTMWNAEFLSSNVIHHVSGKKRLYVTVSCAYTQEAAAELGLTWKKIQRLPRITITSSDTEEAQAPEEDHEETWWEWHPKLDMIDTVSSRNVSDNSDSAHSSFNSSCPLAFRSAPDTLPQPEPLYLTSHQKELGTPQSDIIPRPPRRLNRATQVTDTKPPSKRPFDLEEPPLRYPSAEQDWIADDNRRKRRRTTRSSAPGRTNNGSDAESGSGDARDGDHLFTPRQSIEPNGPLVPYLGTGGSLGIAACSPNPIHQQAPSSTKGSEAYATPFSVPGIANGSPPGYSDTKPDDVEGGSGSDDDDGDENDAMMGDNHNNDNSAKRVGEARYQYGNCDDEMTDVDWSSTSDASQGNSDASSVDRVKHPNSSVKRESDSPQDFGNPWISNY
ncbi:hypothetical protein SLS58_010644 [Diplodia intermedia]|uniref:Uncharacterized protein n=1 Tax=Diplodia intermedia TaxID=856260 RepID=A0ABR3T4I3_9PEZI